MVARPDSERQFTYEVRIAGAPPDAHAAAILGFVRQKLADAPATPAPPHANTEPQD